MDEYTTYLVAAAFGDGAGASWALQRLRASQTRALVGIEDAAVLGRDSCGRLALRDAVRTCRSRRLMVCAATAGAYGLVAGPDGWEALGGSAVGALAARLVAAGFPGGQLCAFGAGLLPGSSVLVAQVDALWVADITGDLERSACGLVLEWLPDETARALRSCGVLEYRREGRGGVSFVRHAGMRAGPAAGGASGSTPATVVRVPVTAPVPA